MNYSKALKIIRSIHGLEQRDLANIIEVDPSYISMIESGKKMLSNRLLMKISSKLKIPKKLIILLSSSDILADEETKIKLGELLLKANFNAKNWE